MVLENLPVSGRPTILIRVGQGPIALAVGADGEGQTEILSLRAVKPKTTYQPSNILGGWSGGAMALCKLPVAGRPTFWKIVVGWWVVLGLTAL